MPYVRAIAAEIVTWRDLHVCLLGTPVSSAETDKPIEMSFEEKTRVCTKNGCTLA